MIHAFRQLAARQNSRNHVRALCTPRRLTEADQNAVELGVHVLRHGS